MRTMECTAVRAFTVSSRTKTWPAGEAEQAFQDHDEAQQGSPSGPEPVETGLHRRAAG
jgi:hypothetical protein